MHHHAIAQHATRVACALLTCFCLVPRAAKAQDHEEEMLHFSHPLLVESPSPDTKIRTNLLWSTLNQAGQTITTRAASIGGEYAFRPWISVEVEMPFVSIDDGASTRSSLSSSEVSLKFASLHLHDYGVILGGGVASELPTGSDTKGIGSAHVVEMAGFVDAGWMYRQLEIVSFAQTSTGMHLRNGEANERTLELSASALYHAGPFVDLLAETQSSRMLGAQGGASATVVAPGLKLHGMGHEGPMAGLSVQLPVSDTREFDRQFMLSLMYHF